MIGSLEFNSQNFASALRIPLNIASNGHLIILLLAAVVFVHRISLDKLIFTGTRLKITLES